MLPMKLPLSPGDEVCPAWSWHFEEHQSLTAMSWAGLKKSQWTTLYIVLN